MADSIWRSKFEIAVNWMKHGFLKKFLTHSNHIRVKKLHQVLDHKKYRKDQEASSVFVQLYFGLLLAVVAKRCCSVTTLKGIKKRTSSNIRRGAPPKRTTPIVTKMNEIKRMLIQTKGTICALN